MERQQRGGRRVQQNQNNLIYNSELIYSYFQINSLSLFNTNIIRTERIDPKYFQDQKQASSRPQPLKSILELPGGSH